MTILNSDYFNGSGYRPLTDEERIAVSGYVQEVAISGRFDPYFVLLPSGEAGGKGLEVEIPVSYTSRKNTITGGNENGSGYFTTGAGSSFSEASSPDRSGLWIGADANMVGGPGFFGAHGLTRMTKIKGVFGTTGFFTQDPWASGHRPSTGTKTKYNTPSAVSITTYGTERVFVKDLNQDVLVQGYNAKAGINYFFPVAGAGDLDEDIQFETRFDDLIFYEQNGVLITYPSNHPDESPAIGEALYPKEAVTAEQGIRDSAFASVGSDRRTTGAVGDASTTVASSFFSSASGLDNQELLGFTLGITNPTIHYYPDDYGQVYFPRGKTGPTKTSVNGSSKIAKKTTNKAIKFAGSAVAVNSGQLFSAYGVKTVEEPDEEESDD